jgi:hypothetical protein
MTSDNEVSEDTIIQTRLLYLNAVVQGVTTGMFVGLGLFTLTIWLVIKGGDVVGPHLSLLGQYFIGYSVTWGGAFIGMIYGFVVGYGIGYAYALIYNWVVDKKSPRTPA